MDNGGADANVTVYYGTSDAGQIAANWSANANINTLQPTGSISTGLTGLTTNTSYFFRMKATNAGGTTWSDAYAFRTGTVALPPAITTAPVSNVATTSVTTAGNLLSYDGNDQPAVTLYYDTDESASTQIPKAFGSLKVWLDANDTGSLDQGVTPGGVGTPTSSGQAVGYWGDKSGKSNHAKVFQLAQNRKPLYLPSSYNSSYPAVHFDGSNDMMTVPSSTSNFDGWEKLTIFLVSENNLNNWDYIIGKGGKDQGNGGWWFGKSTGNWARLYTLGVDGSEAFNSNDTFNNSAIWSVTMGNGMRQLYRDGVKRGERTFYGSITPTSPVTPLSLGATIDPNTGNGNNYGNTKISELLIFKDWIADAGRQKIEGYLAHKWQDTAAFADDHPYKNTAPDFSSPVALSLIHI